MPKFSYNFALVLAILNIIIPGVGTLIAAYMKCGDTEGRARVLFEAAVL